MRRRKGGCSLVILAPRLRACVFVGSMEIARSMLLIMPSPNSHSQYHPDLGEMLAGHCRACVSASDSGLLEFLFAGGGRRSFLHAGEARGDASDKGGAQRARVGVVV